MTSCATAPKSTVNMGDPSTYVKVNFLKGNYDEVIRYSRTLGILNERGDRLSILYYVGVSQLAKKDFENARKSFKLLKERDKSKKYQDISDIRIADSYFVDGKYHQALRLYGPLISRYPTSDYLPYIYYRLVLASQKTGNFKQAKQYYDALQKKYPESLESVRLEMALDPMDLDGYSVQVGSFSDRGKAGQVRVKLLNRGYLASIRESKREDVTYYRVRISCQTRSQAERVAAKLRLEGYSTKVYP